MIYNLTEVLAWFAACSRGSYLHRYDSVQQLKALSALLVVSGDNFSAALNGVLKHHEAQPLLKVRLRQTESIQY